MYPLRDNELFINALVYLVDYPILAIILSGIFTILVQSSAATIGIVMVLAMQKMIPIHSAIYLLLALMWARLLRQYLRV